MLTLSPRPKFKAIPDILKRHDLVLTLLTEREGASEIGSAIRYNDGVWVHYPMSCRSQLGMEGLPTLVMKLSNLLMDGKRVFIHCAAGRDRTGMVFLALLYGNGLSRVEAEEVARRVRPTILDSKWSRDGYSVGATVRGLRVKLGGAPFNPAFASKLKELGKKA